MVAVILVFVLLFAVFWAVTSPWRRSGDAVRRQADDRIREASAEMLDLEAARDAKYREIRDVELDRQTGKLSEEDYAALDAGLRGEAVEILRALDRAQTRLDRLQAADDDPEVGPKPRARPAPDADLEAQRSAFPADVE